MKKLVLLLLFSFASINAQAVKVINLYQADIPVASQADDERLQAARKGLLEVLVKTSLNPQIVNSPVIRSSLARADYYIQEFGYGPGDSAANHYMLHIQFNPADVNGLLRKAGTDYWGEERPLVLIWMLTKDQPNPSQIISNDNKNVADIVKQQGQKFGLPLIFPVMDLPDLNLVSSSSIENNKLSDLNEASKRYVPDAMLIGTIDKVNGIFIGQWKLVLNKQQWDWSNSGQQMSDIVADTISQTSQTLAKHYTAISKSNTEQWLTLEVVPINERNDLQQLTDYLKQLKFVEKVQFTGTDGDAVKLSVLVQGTFLSFQQQSEISKHFLLKSQDAPNNKLVYEWLR